MSISRASAKIVRDTLPAVAQLGADLTRNFYQRMFKAHPELHNVFNTTNQAKGQPKALFNSIAIAASSVAQNDGQLSIPGAAVDAIVHKHCSLLVQPDHYNIVGTNLLETIEEMLGAGKDALDAWGELYWLVANTLITLEEQQYALAEAKAGGWRGRRAFQVTGKNPEADTLTSFYFSPVDGKQLPDFDPGQFTTLWIKGSDWTYTQPRQYTLSMAPNPETWRVTIKDDKDGQVSHHIHNNLNTGDILELSPPFGVFTLSSVDPTAPVALISAGSGMTPMMSMLETTLAHNRHRKIQWLHATDKGSVHMFRQFLIDTANRYKNFDRDVWYANPEEQDERGVGRHYQHEGFVNLDDVKAKLSVDNMHYFICGPEPFMENVQQQLSAWGVDNSRVHTEKFGPQLA